MASTKNSIKIHEHCNIAPPSASQLSLPLTFFDLFWLRLHPVERIFFYSLQSPPSFFYDKVIPKVKDSLSQTLQHFLPLAGKIVWPNDSHKPIIQYNPGDDDGVSFLIAESDVDFNDFLDNSPHEAVQSRSLVPHLDSADSFASVISIQVTLFPHHGFSIGISTHHAVLDGKSSTMFIKAWASLCQIGDESTPPLVSKLEPFFDREVIKDPTGLDINFIKNWNEIASKMDPSHDSRNERTLKVQPFQPKQEDLVRATFELTRVDLDQIKKRVLSKWDTVDGSGTESKPPTLSTFVLTCSYVSVCIAKAFEEAENEKLKFTFGFTADCRARLDPPIPQNYFGNCVCAQIMDIQPEDFTKQDALVIVAEKIYRKTKMIQKGALDGVETFFSTALSILSKGIKPIGVAGSTRFGVYETDFGWGRPSKVEITSVDRDITIGMAESKDGNGNGGVEVGLVLKNHVMGRFQSLFLAGLSLNKG